MVRKGGSCRLWPVPLAGTVDTLCALQSHRMDYVEISIDHKFHRHLIGKSGANSECRGLWGWAGGRKCWPGVLAQLLGLELDVIHPVGSLSLPLGPRQRHPHGCRPPRFSWSSRGVRHFWACAQVGQLREGFCWATSNK